MLLSIKKKLMLILAVLTCFNMSITAATIEPLWECEAHGVSDVVRSSIGFGDKIYVSNVITGCVEEWHKGNKTKEWNVNQFLSSQNENTTLWTAITCDDFGNILVNIGGKEDVAGGTKWLLIPADGSQMQIVEINYPSKVTPGRIDYIGRVIGNLLDDAYAVFAPSENPNNIFDLFGPNQSNNVVLINLRKDTNGQVVSDLNKSRIIPSKTACSIGINVVMNTTYREISSLSSVKDVGSKIYLRNYKNSNLFMWNGNHLTEQKGIGNDGCTARGFDVFTIKDVDYYVVPCKSSDGRTASFEVRYLNTGDVAAQYSTNGTEDSEYSSYTARVSSDGKSAVIYAFNYKDKIGVYTFKPDGYVELIQDLSIDSDTTLKVGETAVLNAMITPSNATNKMLSWVSMDESVAAVDNNGMISAIAPGNTKIIATTTDGTELSDTCAVTVIQLVQDLKIDTDTTLKVGETAVLNAMITPSNATNKMLSWVSMDESVAAVDNNGMISAIAPGNTKIIATTTDGTELSDTCAVTVIQLVQDLKIDTDTTLNVGETAVLKATITPENATNKTLIWASNNIAVATVINGTVTALSAGTATITATTTDGTGLSAACTVTVKYPTIYVQSISIEEEKTLNVGETTTITATISPSNASNKSLNWTSLNTDVATVSNGVVTAKSVGTATITATTTDGTILSDTCVITVVQLVETLTIDRKKTLSVGETASITATISPSNATNKSLNWTSLNTDVATVSNGVVTAKSVGTATITATTTDGTILSDTCVITVVQLVETLTIDRKKTLSVGETASITATISPSNATNKSLNWTSLNTDVATVSNGVVTAKSIGTATITATTTDGTILSDTCVVTVVQLVETLTIDSEKTLNIGETATITATILPDNASNKSLNWHSLNRDIATVSNGVVTAKSAGTATITATTTDGTNLSDTCVVTVNQPIIEQLWVHDMSSVGSAVRHIACVSDSEVAATNISFSGGSDNVIFFNASGQTSKVHDVAKFLNENKIGTTNDSIGFSPYGLGCGIDVDGVGNIVVNLGFPSATSATNFVAIAPDGTMKHIVCEVPVSGEAARADFLGVTGDIFTNGYIGLTPSGMNYAFVYNIYEGEQDKDYSYLVNSDEVTFSSDTKLFFPNKETKLYLTPNDNWKIDNARFAAYFFGSDGYSWASMTAVEGETDLYEVTIPTGSWTAVIFCRMNPDTSENNWDNRWNQTADLFYGGVNNHFIVPNGSWNGANTGWTISAPEFYVYQRSLKGLRYSDGTSALTIMEGDNFSQGKATNSGATAFVVNGITYIVMPTPDESGARANAFKIVNVATGEVALTCQGAEGFATNYAQDFSSYVNEDGTVSIAQLVQGRYLAMYVFDPSGNYEPEPVVPVGALTIEKEKILEIGESADIAVTFSPDSISNKTLQWTSSDESIATISNGTVTAHSLGTVKITAKTTNNLSDVCIVTVVKATELFSIESNRVIGVGETADIKVKKMPETNDSIGWESSDESIATVYNGIVSAVSEGTVKIVATTTDGSNLSDTCIVTVVQETISLGEVRIYINPGHGSWTANDRPFGTVKHGANNAYTDAANDTTNFFESNTNLQKAFGVLEKLIDYGVPFDRTKNQNNDNSHRVGAALDLTQNIVMSHVKCGASPAYIDYTTHEENPDNDYYNRSLSEIAAEVETNYFDMFISIHSNAHTDGSTVNYLYFAIDGYGSDDAKDALSKEMSRCGWNYSILDRHQAWTHYDYTMTAADLAAGKGKIAKQQLGVLRHDIPGYLVEGHFFTYQPARHRAMNWDVCRQEGVAYARGIADYFGWEKESTGDIYGVVRDLYEEFTHEYYNAREGTNDVYLPLNNVQVTLVKEDVVIDTYSTDDEYNGAFVFTNLEPGTYTLEFYHEDYNSVVPVTVTVSEAETSYPSVFLEKIDSANSSETVTNVSEKGKGSTAVETIKINDSEEVIEYYNLQGMRVENPEKGIYIKKQGSKATKVILK